MKNIMRHKSKRKPPIEPHKIIGFTVLGAIGAAIWLR
jgi:hypothetical protein